MGQIEKIDTTNRSDMIAFLTNHERYDLLNSWNNATSYSKNIKIYNLNVDAATKDKFYQLLADDMVSTTAYDMAAEVLEDFRDRHNGSYCIGTNGRSDGYLVLYRGFKRGSDYKSFCTTCGQRSYKKATKDDCRCGRCGNLTRINYTNPLWEYGITYQEMDMDEDFSEWTDEELRDRVELVVDFDETCDAYIKRLVEIANRYDIVEETVYVPKKRYVLQEI